MAFQKELEWLNSLEEMISDILPKRNILDDLLKPGNCLPTTDGLPLLEIPTFSFAISPIVFLKNSNRRW